MKCTVVDGKALAAEIKQTVKEKVAEITKAGGKISFVAVVVGDNSASKIYVDKKQRECAEIGIDMRKVELGADIAQNELNNILAELSSDETVHAILLQLPLPNGLDAVAAIENIAPVKDVDGLTAENFGLLAQGNAALCPCTALGIMHILKAHNITLAGANAVVVGRSNIVGKPVAMMLTHENATVTLAHSKTKNLKDYTKNADIVIAAVGKPNLITADMIKAGAAVIDVGINRMPSGLIMGDVDFESAQKVAALLTPVPGGVGPLTIAFLLSNILKAYNIQTGEGDKNV